MKIYCFVPLIFKTFIKGNWENIGMFRYKEHIFKNNWVTSLVVQWLTLSSQCRRPECDPWSGTRSHMLQLRPSGAK